MRTIFITVPGWMEFRNFIATDAFRILKSREDLRLVVFTPSNLHGMIPKSENVVLEDLEAFEPSFTEKAFRKAQELVFFNINRTETVKTYELMLKRKRYRRYLLFKLVRKVLGKRWRVIRGLERLDMFLSKFSYGKHDHLFEKYEPDLLLSCNFMSRHDLVLVKAAKLRGVPVVCMVANWDHLFKGRLPKCDRVIVWNDFQKNQLVKYYRFDDKNIMVAGIPHQDYFKPHNLSTTREELLKSIGVPLDKKLIVYTTMSNTASPDEPEFIEILCQAITEGRIKYPSHLHVRVHPGEDIERYEKLKKYGGVITFEKAAGGAFLSEKDMTHYADLLSSADVLVNIASTVTLDAAALDVPIVNIAFDSSQKRDLAESTARFFKFEHYTMVAKSGGVKIAKNGGELMDFVNRYLSDREMDREGRAKLAQELCHKLDGKTGERIAGYIIGFPEKREIDYCLHCGGELAEPKSSEERQYTCTTCGTNWVIRKRDDYELWYALFDGGFDLFKIKNGRIIEEAEP